MSLELWAKVEKTDPKFTKKVTFGRGFTAIDPYYQIKNATEQFGMFGKEWGLKDIKYDFSLMDEKGNTVAFVQAVFWYPEGSFPLSSSAKTITGKTPKFDEDIFKKLETNLITKALSRLGFNADIFLGKFEDQAYLHELETESYRKENAAKPATMKKIKDLILKTETKEDQFLKFLQVQLKVDIESISELTEQEAQAAIKVLNEKLERMK